METPKEKAIKAAYGEYFIKENIDENGWTNNPPEGMLKSIPCEAKEMHITFGSPETWCRPRSITGLENNRGWTRIESEEDMPKEYDVDYFCFHKNGKIIIRTFFKYLGWGEFDCEILDQSDITHYQPVQVPKPPIF